MNLPLTPACPGPQPSLLIVDDNEPFRRHLLAAITSSGIFRLVSAAADGVAALTMLSAAARDDPLVLPDAALIDLYMPRFNGIELLNELRRHETLRHIRGVIMAEWDGPFERNAAHHAGCHAFIRQPRDIVPPPRWISDLMSAVQSSPTIRPAPASV